MKSDFLNELGVVGFTARIKRMSDSLIYDARKIYENLNLEIEPNWHLVFLLLKKEKSLTVSQIKQHLGLSHPAIIKIVTKMKKSEFLVSKIDDKDTRKKIIQLTEKGIIALPKLEENWQLVEDKLSEFVDEEFLEKLNQVEASLGGKSLYQRFIEK